MSSLSFRACVEKFCCIICKYFSENKRVKLSNSWRAVLLFVPTERDEKLLCVCVIRRASHLQIARCATLRINYKICMRWEMMLVSFCILIIWTHFFVFAVTGKNDQEHQILWGRVDCPPKKHQSINKLNNLVSCRKGDAVCWRQSLKVP